MRTCPEKWGIINCLKSQNTFLNKTFGRNYVKWYQNTRSIQLESLQFKKKNRKWTYKEKMREWSKDARYTENEKTGYESISAGYAVTAFISLFKN
jgi:hypothetical protein